MFNQHFLFASNRVDRKVFRNWNTWQLSRSNESFTIVSLEDVGTIAAMLYLKAPFGRFNDPFHLRWGEIVEFADFFSSEIGFFSHERKAKIRDAT